MYDTLDLLLRLALIAESSPNKKQSRKLALKFVKKVSQATKSAILDKVLTAVSFKEEVYHHVNWYLDITGAADECSGMGYPGMVIVGDEALPLQINMKSSRIRAGEEGTTDVASYDQELKDDRRWALANEVELQLAGAHAAMNYLNLKHLECQVVLFISRGFSGTPTTYEIEPGVANRFSRRVGNSQYFQ